MVGGIYSKTTEQARNGNVSKHLNRVLYTTDCIGIVECYILHTALIYK